MTSCCCELSQLPSCRNAGANRDRTSLPRGVRTALSPKQGGKVGEKAQPCPLNRRTFLTPPLCVCYTLDKLLKCTPALQHVCCRPPCEGVGRNPIKRRAGTDWPSRPPCEGVGRNPDAFKLCLYPASRPPCEGVGRNTMIDGFHWLCIVALHVRAWVEIGPSGPIGPCMPVALHVRAWVEMKSKLTATSGVTSPSM